jgi:hypothetical protein
MSAVSEIEFAEASLNGQVLDCTDQSDCRLVDAGPIRLAGHHIGRRQGSVAVNDGRDCPWQRVKADPMLLPTPRWLPWQARMRSPMAR